MKASHIAWTTVAAVTTVAVATTAGIGVAVHKEFGNLDHGQPPAVPAMQQVIAPAEPADVNREQLIADLNKAAADPALATFGAQVVDTTTGDVVWTHDDSLPLIPASSTKILTTSAALYTLPLLHRVRTEVMRVPDSSVVVIKAAGDVWMNTKQISELTAAIKATEGAEGIDTVFVDTSVWSGPTQVEDWDPDNISAGYVAPIEPVMLYGGRLYEGDEAFTTGDVPRSFTPALDVAQALAAELDAPNVGLGPVPANAEVIAATQSQPLAMRLEQMMKHSDNVAAEAIAREVAAARGAQPSFASAAAATVDILREAGHNVDGVLLVDNSGLSDSNRIPAAVLNELVSAAITDTPLRPLTGYLPVAAGEGTLQKRYVELSGRGFVRAKTGTLTGVSAL
ncbi:MAG: D-alanyl-D-alanine carboxypeptidase/D-alanyl-D-alanine-endopeptidase, partial [Corynebacterium sp.]|nr:D-alanyl-D-alanine carboxypeptidase/D-alanyl-D-alanine-endopeptidase [Corynebacterium sp.]